MREYSKTGENYPRIHCLTTAACLQQVVRDMHRRTYKILMLCVESRARGGHVEGQGA